MGNGCQKCCGKVQDWCRDSCGCCPCDCCKTKKVEVKSEQNFEQRIERKPIPFGSYSLFAGITNPHITIRFYSYFLLGARTKDGSYTSPVLEIRTWKKFQMQSNAVQMTVNQRVALGGMQTERDNADRDLGPTAGSERRYFEREEEIIVIPVESILSIKITDEVKKGQTQIIHIRREKTPEIKLSCCGKIKKWCAVTFCCCDCSDCCRRYHDRWNKKIQPKPPQLIPQITNRTAERRILVTIEQIHYSNIHTPSHTRVLTVPDQTGFFKERFQPELLLFYLLDDANFDEKQFDSYRMQAAILCRLVTELKAMIGSYPDESALKELITKRSLFSTGDIPNEALEELAGI